MKKETKKIKADLKNNEAVQNINNFIEKFYGKVFDEYVKASGKPEIRNDLKSQTIEFHHLYLKVQNAKDVKDLTSDFDNKADILEKEIELLLEKFAIFTLQSNAQLDEDAAALRHLKLEAKETDDELSEYVPDSDAKFEKVFDSALKMVENFKQVNTLVYIIDEDMLKKPLNNFRWWRKFTKIVDWFLWILVIILGGGLALKLVVSKAEKFLIDLSPNFLIAIVVYLFFILLKEKYISPFLKNLLLGSQKTNLLKSLEQLHQARMSFTLKFAIEEKESKARSVKPKSILPKYE